MLKGLVDFALNNRFLIMAAAVLLFIWGVISFRNLPIEAYPDVANNYVTIITSGRAAPLRRSNSKSRCGSKSS